MKTRESFLWLGGVIAAHTDRKVIGRTRLQKTIKLLQRLKLPTDYLYTLFFYGPYSEGVFSDIRLLERFGLVKETEHKNSEGVPYFVIQATAGADLPEIEPFKPPLRLLERADPLVLELAATYDTFREMGSGHAEALDRLRLKKGRKCNEGREEMALELLRQLRLPIA